jgi:hypothetical protein
MLLIFEKNLKPRLESLMSKLAPNLVEMSTEPISYLLKMRSIVATVNWVPIRFSLSSRLPKLARFHGQYQAPS